MSDKNYPFKPRYFLNPLNWPVWLGLGLMWLTTRLPYRGILMLGSLLGGIAMLYSAERRRIARTNIRLCFPELDKQAQQRLLRHSFYNGGISVLEFALALWGSEKKLRPLLHIEGLENLHEAEQAGKGIIMLGAHYTSLEMGGRIMSAHVDNFIPTYKRFRIKVFERVMVWSRKRIHADAIKSVNMREVMRYLKHKKIVWYAPDQDFGLKSSVFAPFMGIPAATLTLASRLAKASGAPVLPWYVERLPGAQGYKLRIGPALQNFPSGDDVRDATAINDAISQQLRRVPEQYLWGHRRFKTRPRGAPQAYALRRDKIYRRYSLVLALMTVPAIGYTLWQAFRYRDKQYLLERLGLVKHTFVPNTIWLHAASVGEINAILPLINLFLEREPQRSVLFTCNTPSGGMTARKKLPANVRCHYLPIDWQYASRRFLAQAQPVCALITETELWPHLFGECYTRGIPIILVNGRLSRRSLDAPAWLRSFMFRAGEYIYKLLARSEQDREHFLELRGIYPETIQVVGNIKFSAQQHSDVEPFECARPYVLAASTRDQEEQLVVSSWQSAKTENRLLIIVPRHPHRLRRILQDLSQHRQHIAVRSRNEAITEQTRIYIADTFGELNSFIAGSEFVIMGGSFKPFGGQNILEVGLQGKAVIFGPHMDNFTDEARQFVERDAGIQVRDEAALTTAIDELFQNPDRANEIGNHARQLMHNSAHVAEDYYSEIKKICAEFFQDQTPA